MPITAIDLFGWPGTLAEGISGFGFNLKNTGLPDAIV